MTRLASASALLPLLLLAACGGDDGIGGVDADPAACTGAEVRCAGLTLQACQDGVFVTTESCGFACDPVAGCSDCDPNAGPTCDGDAVVSCNSDGTYGPVIEACGEGEACTVGECTRACTADGVDLIYVVDDAYRLLSFDPRLVGTATDPFVLIGPMSCPAASQPVPGWGGGVTPFSMAVDREATAWVLYTTGEIFHVST
ncbi:MAG: hypothetical protein R2939_11280, partial [Kofleriaceae bacterium]